MNDKKKAYGGMAAVFAAIAVLTYIAFVGIGAGHRGSIGNIRLGLDLAGGVSITYQAVEENPSEEAMNDTVFKMQKRAEGYSTEAAVYKEGSNRVNVDIPNVKDANEVLEALGKAGSIQFTDESGNVVLDGSDIETAQAVTQTNSLTGMNQNVVKLSLNSKGAAKFAEATAANVGKRIAIVYDGSVISAPVVETAITDGTAVISGQETYEESEELASTIRIGALPLELEEIQSKVVGATLGLQAVNTSLLAGTIGLVLIILFMLVMYRIAGLAASIALVFYVIAEMVLLNGLDVTLTLPGIAGIILSIGMAVDANVIIFTRIREELATGKTVRSSIKLGFDKALSAIIDGNVTTLIAAAVLWVKGSGTVKGFAQTLAIGIVLSMFTALFVTKVLLNAFYAMGCDDVKFYGVEKQRKSIDFVGNMKKTYGLAGILIVIGIAALFVNKAQLGGILNYGLDFKGGTSTEITFPEDTGMNEELKLLVEKEVMNVAGSNCEMAQLEDRNALVIKTDELSLEQRQQIETALEKQFGVTADNIQMESISAVVSGEMKTAALLSVAIAGVCMLLYIWIRFKNAAFGVGAVLALFHDVMIVLMVYAVTRISVGNTFIACMLTIVGYSINATIVIYDRIRENMAAKKHREGLKDIVNASINQTFTRSINTSLTTLIMVVMLAILGVDSVRQFAIPLMAGVLAGGYSSVCIAGTLWYLLHKKAKA